MAWFILKRGPDIEVDGVSEPFVAGKPVKVADEALIRKLRKHRSFEEAPDG